MKTPLRFVPASIASRASTTPTPISHVLDDFFVAQPHVRPREWIVGVDGIGELAVRSLDTTTELFSDARRDLAHHDALGSGPPRCLDVGELYVMGVELVEQPAGQRAGATDASVHLYGTLLGPFPSASEDAPSVAGQLTVTRNELLQALVWSTPWTFRAAPKCDGGGGARCLHLMLPGTRVSELSQGRGVVLAYPLLPPELSLADPSNELLVTRIAHDLLMAAARDLDARSGESWLGRMFGFGGDEVEVPDDGTLEEYVTLSSQVLSSIGGWPSDEMRAVASRVAGSTGELQREHVTTVTARGPSTVGQPRQRADTWVAEFHSRAPAAARQVTSAREVAAMRTRVDPERWTSDFEPSAPASAAGASGPGRVGAPDEDGWASDFDGVAAPTPAPPRSPRRPAAADDDWSDDFD